MEGCPVKFALGLVSGKWKLRILWELNQQEVIRFNELQRRLEGISSVMLSKSLEELERARKGPSAGGGGGGARLVHREQYPEIPPRVEYSLTALGRSIDPYLRALGEWGMQAYEAIQAG